jgi:hypothetical protein
VIGCWCQSLTLLQQSEPRIGAIESHVLFATPTPTTRSRIATEGGKKLVRICPVCKEILLVLLPDRNGFAPVFSLGNTPRKRSENETGLACLWHESSAIEPWPVADSPSEDPLAGAALRDDSAHDEPRNHQSETDTLTQPVGRFNEARQGSGGGPCSLRSV